MGNKSPLESAFPCACAIRALESTDTLIGFITYGWDNVLLGHGCDSEKKKKINERRAILKNIEHGVSQPLYRAK